MKSHRDRTQGDERRESVAGHGVPGKTTLVEQLPTVTAPAQRAIDGPTSPGQASAIAPGMSQDIFSPRNRAVGEAARSAGASPGIPRLDLAPRDKAVGSTASGMDIGGPKEMDPQGGAKADGAQPPAEKQPKKKKAGVESFTVEWSKGLTAGPTAVNLRLDYNAKFKKDDDHDPALAEFRQNAMTKWEITDGPRKGAKGDTSPLHDDHYSRADDLAGHKITDQLFTSNDNPGWDPGQLDKDDVLEYAFTAEQMIIDTSDGNKVIEKRGPHTATIKGKDPRTYGNVPKKLG